MNNYGLWRTKNFMFVTFWKAWDSIPIFLIHEITFCFLFLKEIPRTLPYKFSNGITVDCSITCAYCKSSLPLSKLSIVLHVLLELGANIRTSCQVLVGQHDTSIREALLQRQATEEGWWSALTRVLEGFALMGREARNRISHNQDREAFDWSLVSLTGNSVL